LAPKRPEKGEKDVKKASKRRLDFGDDAARGGAGVLHEDPKTVHVGAGLNRSGHWGCICRHLGGQSATNTDEKSARVERFEARGRRIRQVNVGRGHIDSELLARDEKADTFVEAAGDVRERHLLFFFLVDQFSDKPAPAFGDHG
jgi:hypothetical protein